MPTNQNTHNFIELFNTFNLDIDLTKIDFDIINDIETIHFDKEAKQICLGYQYNNKTCFINIVIKTIYFIKQ